MVVGKEWYTYSHTHTHAHAHTRAYAYSHTHTLTHACMHILTKFFIYPLQQLHVTVALVDQELNNYDM